MKLRFFLMLLSVCVLVIISPAMLSNHIQIVLRESNSNIFDNSFPPCTSERTACYNNNVNLCDPKGWKCVDDEKIFEKIIELENKN